MADIYLLNYAESVSSMMTCTRHTCDE